MFLEIEFVETKHKKKKTHTKCVISSDVTLSPSSDGVLSKALIADLILPIILAAAPLVSLHNLVMVSRVFI